LEDVPTATPDDLIWRDLRPVLDGAIDRLPSKYRTPFILCYLEGMTNAQAARHLGCPPGTIATRLSRARQQLRSRLAKHGVALPVSLVATLMVPRGLVAATVRTATAVVASSAAAAGIVPTQIVSLMEGVGKSMVLDKLRSFAVALMLVVAAGSGAGVLTYRGFAGEPPTQQEEGKPHASIPASETAAEEWDPRQSAFRTTNFLVTASTRRVAQVVGEAAERDRKLLAERWLGKELPPWPQLCPIDVKLTPGGTGAATSFGFEQVAGEGGRKRHAVTNRHMNQEGPLDRILTISLPHEITHTILADHFVAPVPRWADEGAAMLAEDAEEQHRHEKQIRNLVTAGRAFRLRYLVALRDYPKDVLVLHAQGYSLTRFLVERKDRKTFLAFVGQGMAGDWDAALRDHYRYRDLDELERDWLKSLHPEGQQAALTQPPGGLPPQTVLASVDKDGDLVLRWPLVHSYVPKTTQVSANPGAAPRTVTTYELVTGQATRRSKLQEMRVFNAVGERFRSQDLPRLLAKETTVLFAPDGLPVDPFYLRVIKPGTLVLIPTRADPPPPPAPPVAVVQERAFDTERIPAPVPAPIVPAPPMPSRQ
jgi:hypothetical protein